MKPLLRGPIARRLFLFNILVVFMPVAGFFSLSIYEDQLLAGLEDSMVQQGRTIAAWLQEGPVTAERSQGILAALRRNHTARIRIVDAEGVLLADSSLPRAEDTVPAGNTAPAGNTMSAGKAAPATRAAETTVLYRTLSLPVRLARKYLLRPQAPLESADYYSGKTVLDGAEIIKALGGSYGAMTRISTGGQTSVTLYSAIPVPHEGTIAGAVLVSGSTYRILSNLYDFRLETGKIFVLSLAAAALVSLILALTISSPLSRLRKEAESAIAGKPTRKRPFHLTGRNDEIDRLSAALSGLVRDLGRQIEASENFASDAAHEMRNRISGIRNAAELIAGGTPAETASSVSHILENAARMEKILAALRTLSRIEADDSGPGTADAAAVLEGVTEAVRTRFPGLRFILSLDDSARKLRVPVSDGHLEIVLENLLENAASFSPPGGRIFIRAAGGKTGLTIGIRDEGPGIPEEHLGRVFDRFFSWRSGDTASHAGIGLSIVEAVMRKAGGSAGCSNHSDGGAVFTLEFPSA